MVDMFCACALSVNGTNVYLVKRTFFYQNSLLIFIQSSWLIFYLPDREASLIKKEHCRCGPHPLQVTSSRARPPLVKGTGYIGPLFPEFRGWPLWFTPPLHCGDLGNSHRRLFLAPHCTLRPSHPSVGGNAWGLEIVGQLDM